MDKMKNIIMNDLFVNCSSDEMVKANALMKTLRRDRGLDIESAVQLINIMSVEDVEKFVKMNEMVDRKIEEMEGTFVEVKDGTVEISEKDLAEILDLAFEKGHYDRKVNRDSIKVIAKALSSYKNADRLIERFKNEKFNAGFIEFIGRALERNQLLVVDYTFSKVDDIICWSSESYSIEQETGDKFALATQLIELEREFLV